MGRSAKVHKRVSKPSTSAKSHPSTADAASAAQDPKSRASAKAAAAPSKEKQRKARAALEDLRHGKDGPVLAGVDYLSLAHGGRRKAKQEEEKMRKLKTESEASRNAEKMEGMQL